MKILVIAHGHPDFSVGGAELAAYNLYSALKDRPDVDEITFLARTSHPSVCVGAISLKRTNEYLWRQDIGDWFRLRSSYPNSIYTTFREFLRTKQPDVVFVHHFANIGIEILRELRRTLPDAFIALTLHEYMAICQCSGQMVKNNTKRLCYRETIEDCNLCFPERSVQDFWLRKHFLQKHFEAADIFISPSEFLRQRYIDWGIPSQFITVIENGQPAFSHLRDTQRRDRKNRFGFFGQVTEYKGVDLLLNALHLMSPKVRKSILVEIHGANLENQRQSLRELIERLQVPLIAEGTLRWVGPYEPQELHRRMSKVDWVVVPSIWWENSPMVIQEAFCCGRPVICSGIGGMAEKVRDRVDGLHFEARNPTDLADVLTEAATTEGLWDGLASNIRQPINYNECAEAYLRLVA